MKPTARITHFLCFALLVTATTGCAPRRQLTFPYRTLKASPEPQWFDVNKDGKPDFAVSFNRDGRMDAVAYDDDQDGRIDRSYRLDDYPADRVPHLVILLDSVPYRLVQDRYAAGEFRWFGPPRKVIPPFPSMTEVCYTEVMHAAPLGGAIDQYYDRRRGTLHSGIVDRAIYGYRQPWERYVHYTAKFSEGGMSYVEPIPWYAAELERARRTIDESPDRTTYVYLTSASGMACRYGKSGVDQVLDGAAQLCLQLLYERRGAIKISMMADHGHNLVPSVNLDVTTPLVAAGFHVTKDLQSDDDIVLELSGLVTSAAAHTRQPARAATTLLSLRGIQHTYYMDGDRVVVRDAAGAASVECRADRFRYTPDSRDVLGYAPVFDRLRSEGKLDPAGYASHDDLFAATVDHEYPDAPARIWEAFHGQVRNTPDLMFTTLDGFCAGVPYLKRFITMQSTHGSLNQINSATFLMSMTDRGSSPLRSRKVMPTIVPGYVPAVRADR